MVLINLREYCGLCCLPNTALMTERLQLVKVRLNAPVTLIIPVFCASVHLLQSKMTYQHTLCRFCTFVYRYVCPNVTRAKCACACRFEFCLCVKFITYE